MQEKKDFFSPVARRWITKITHTVFNLGAALSQELIPRGQRRYRVRVYGVVSSGKPGIGEF